MFVVLLWVYIYDSPDKLKKMHYHGRCRTYSIFGMLAPGNAMQLSVETESSSFYMNIILSVSWFYLS